MRNLFDRLLMVGIVAVALFMAYSWYQVSERRRAAGTLAVDTSIDDDMAYGAGIEAATEAADADLQEARRQVATPPPLPKFAGVLGGETYDEYDTRRDSYRGGYGYSHGSGCTVDCGGHDAGYRWASQRGIDNPDDCGGNSWSFNEGCRAYAEENGRSSGETDPYVDGY